MDPDPALSTAVLLYLGVGVDPMPNPQLERLIGYFGPELGTQLQVQVEGLRSDFFEVDWAATNESLQEATARVGKELQTRRADLSTDAVEALCWWFSWLWR